MELDTSTKIPLLNIEDSYNDINSLSIIDKLKCVSYKNIYTVKPVIGKKKIYSEERVKVVQDDKSVIPGQFVYEKGDRFYMSGDYISVLLLDSMKHLKRENNELKDTVNKLQTRLSNIEKKL